MTIFTKSYLFTAFPLPLTLKELPFTLICPFQQVLTVLGQGCHLAFSSEIVSTTYLPITVSSSGPLQNHTSLSSNSCPFTSVKDFFFLSAVYPNRMKKIFYLWRASYRKITSLQYTVSGQYKRQPKKCPHGGFASVEVVRISISHPTPSKSISAENDLEDHC